MHAHCIVPDAAKLINHPLEAPALLWSNVGDRLAQMDKSGVDVEALSINPFWYRAERDAAEQLIKVQNEALVEFCAGHPDRFVGFATSALQFPDLAAQQVEHAVKKLGFRGVGVAGSVSREIRNVRSLRWSISNCRPIRRMNSSSGVAKRCIGKTTEARSRLVISEMPSSDIV